MPVIDLVKWDGAPDVLVSKFPSQELSTWTQLIVNETQEAFLVKEGVYQGPFGAGRHTLATENLPLLRSAIGVPFGGQSPFTAEVWFVNKLANLDVKWGTADPIQIQDPAYGILVPVRAFGSYGVRVAEPKKFLLKLVGTLLRFDTDFLRDYFRGVFTTRIKTSIATAIVKNGKSVLELTADLDRLSADLLASLGPEVAQYGLHLEQFNINSISLPENDPAVVTLRDALAKRAEMRILGYSYQQERSFDVLQDAAGNQGTAGGVMGAGLGLGMGVGIGGAVGNSMGQMTQIIQPGPDAGGMGLGGGGKPGANGPCSNCGTLIPLSAKFCPNCADPLHNCPGCQADNKPDATHCHACRAPLPRKCGDCAETVPVNAKFCPGCGKSTVAQCGNCKAVVTPGSKFCPECGTPQKG